MRRVPRTAFKPGQSGNPGGAPRGKRISTWMAEFGEMSEAQIEKLDRAKLPQNALIALARIKAAKAEAGTRDADCIMDRTEGKVAQPMELGGPEGGPLRFTLSLGDGAAE